MRKILSIALAVLTILTAASCTKEDIAASLYPSTQPGVRLLTATFATASLTKTTVNGVTPEWSVGDKIMLLNASGKQEIEVVAGTGEPAAGKAVINGYALTINTTLEGQLYAVYPATATTATMAKTDEIPIIIPQVQDGTFASANICVGKSETVDDTSKETIFFKNATAVMKFSQSTAGISSIQVESKTAITGPAVYNCASSATTGASGKTLSVVCGSSATDIFFAVAPGTLATGTKFIFMSDDKYLLKTTTSEKAVAVNDLVDMGSLDALGIADNGTDLWVQLWTGGPRFATINVGAAALDNYGDYYAWGEIQPKGNYDKTYSNYFDTKDGGTSFIKYNSSGGKTVLDPEDDVAHVKWGGNWRMPTNDEWLLFYKNTYRSWVTVNKVSGMRFTSKEDSSKSIFLPAAGDYTDSKLAKDGEYGYYWSSSLNTSEHGWAYGAYVSSDIANTSYYKRFQGLTVRPVCPAPSSAF